MRHQSYINKKCGYFLCLVGIDCGQLPDIENGQVTHNPDTKFLSIATYTCRNGFVLDDERNRRRRCEADGDYSGSEPSCLRKLYTA